MSFWDAAATTMNQNCKSMKALSILAATVRKTASAKGPKF
jgi:hypothetical protein